MEVTVKSKQWQRWLDNQMPSRWDFECWLYYEPPSKWFCEWNESLGPCSKRLLLIIFYTRFQCCCLSCSRVAGCVRGRPIWRIMTEIISARVSLQPELGLIIPLVHEHIGDCLTSFSICCLSCQYSCRCFSPWFAQQGSERSCVGKFNIFSR